MRGLCFQMQGDYALALGEFELPVKANAQSPLAMRMVAYLLATAPDDRLRDGVRAKALASVAASQPHGAQWATLTVLAAASSGDPPAVRRPASQTVSHSPWAASRTRSLER